MYAGRVVEEGPAEDLFERPLHPYSGALAAAFPTIGDPRARFAPIGLPGDPPDPRSLPTGCAFHPRCALATDECTTTDPPLERTPAWSPGGLPARRRRPRHEAPPGPADRRRGTRPDERRPARGADLEVTFWVATAVPNAKGVDGVDLDLGSGRDPRAGRRVRLRQDHAGSHAPRSGAAVRRRGAYDGAGLGYRRARLRAYRREVQLVLQDPTGALNPRHTVYESVAEGLRVHKVVDRRRAAGTSVTGRPGRRGAVARRDAAPGAVLPELPARALRWAAPAGRHRRGAWSSNPTCSSPTSRSRPWTRRSVARSWRCC